MHRFFLNAPLAENANEALLSGEEQHHLVSVLRLGPGDRAVLTDPAGTVCEAEIVENTDEGTLFRIIERMPPETENTRVRITLFQGVPKGSKSDLIVQKGTELGISAFVPFYSKRSVVKPSGSDSKKRQRLQRIAREAAKQSGRVFVPEVSEFVPFAALEEAFRPFDAVLLAYENENNIRLKDLLQEMPRDRDLSVAVIVGPEGGFEDAETVRLALWGAKLFTFGRRILRTETAGIAAAAQINYEFDEG